MWISTEKEIMTKKNKKMVSFMSEMMFVSSVEKFNLLIQCKINSGKS